MYNIQPGKEKDSIFNYRVKPLLNNKYTCDSKYIADFFQVEKEAPN